MKKDVVKKFQEIAKNKGMALTQNDVDVILDVLEEKYFNIAVDRMKNRK